MKGEENNKNKKLVEEARKEIMEENSYWGGGKIPFSLTFQEKIIIRDPVLDTCSSLNLTVSLIRTLREANNWNNYLDSFKSAPDSCLSRLKSFGEALPNDDYWKCAQAAKNNGDLLNKAINLVHPKCLTKSQELKTKIINNQENWYLDRGGTFHEVVGTDWIETLTPPDYQEVKRTIIEEIKKDPQKWKVEWTTLLPYETEEELECLVKYTILVSVKNPKRSHFVDGLTAREREEIAQVLKVDLPKNHWELETGEEKQRVLNDPNKWILGPNGQIIALESLWSYTYDNRRVFSYSNVFKTNGLKREENPLSFSELNPKQFEEIQQVFLKEIESNPQDWKIEKESELWVIKHKSGRRHYKNILLKGEKDEWWEKVERILIDKSVNNSPISSELDNKKNNSSPAILIVTVISVVVGLVLIVFLIKKKRKSRLK